MKVTSPIQTTFVGFLFICTLMLSPVMAQSGGTPLALAPGSPAGSYPLSDIDTVNLFNGRVNVHIPTLTAGGRGDAKGRMSFNWSSPASYHVRSDVDPNNGSPLNYVEGGGGGAFSTDGLTLGMAQVYGVQAGSQTSYPCSMGDYSTYQKTLTRLYFVEPDGTEHEMRDVQSGGQAQSVSICALNGYSRGKKFVSTDGSGATFLADDPITDWIFAGGDFPLINPPGYLLLSNGTRYRVNDGLDVTMRDRNGNLLSQSFVNNFPVFYYQLKDSLNRLTTLGSGSCPSPTTGSCQLLSYKGYGGTSRSIAFGGTNALRLILPNNLYYEFHIDGYGDLIRIDLPTGGTIEYDYGPGIDGTQPDPYAWIQGLQNSIPGTYPLGFGAGAVYRRATERRVYKAGHVLENRQTFSKPEYFNGSITPSNLGYVDKKQYDGSGNLKSTERHYFYGAATNSFNVGPIDYPSWLEGREYHSEFYDQSGNLLQQTNLTWEQRTSVSWWTGSANDSPQMDPRLSQSTTILETGQSTTTTNTYDATVPYNSLTDVYVYDYGGALLRRTQTTFVKTLNSTDYTGASITNPSLPYMRDLPSQVSIYDSSGERSRTTFEYDNYSTDSTHAGLVARSGISGLDASFSTSYTYRGNPTGVTKYLLTSGVVTGSVSTYAQYDVAGNVVKAIDARGNATTIAYTDCFGAPNADAQTNSAPTELSSVSQSSFAYPTTITNALSQVTHTQFDFYLGQAVDFEDVNGIVGSAAFNDSLDRVKLITEAANQSTAIKSQKSYSYDDTNRIVTTTSDLSSFNDSNPLKAESVFDLFGRLIETRQYEGGSNYIATQIQYDDLGREFKHSNPFRPWQSETAVWTTSAFDALGREISITSPDSSVISTAYTGNSTTVTDQAGKQRKMVKDALGRVTQVNEAPNDGSYNFQTTYGYDAANNLISVAQGSQTRTFVYDTLGRLTSVTNPENGTSTFTYDNNGNMLTRVDARSVTATLAYDVLNRVTSTSYNDSPQTPTINYFYDSQSLPSGAPSYTRGSSTGRLVATTYGGGSEGTYHAYDAKGRVVQQYQRTDSTNYLVEATYNQADRMLTQTYPDVPGAGDRRTVSYSHDGAGRASSLSTSATSYAPAASVSSIGYAPNSAVASETYGNNLIRAVVYNSRLQPVQLKLGTSGSPTSIMSITYNYGSTTNNGNLVDLSYAGGGLSYSQTFGYDELNRLTTSQEGSTWSQTNTYDRYGNRSVGGNLAYSSTTNRISTSGYSYDAGGNLTNDTFHTYTFDGQNRISKVDSVLAYVYNGDGKRVRKLVNENLRFVYGIDGELISEYSGSNGALQKEYVYCASGLAATIEPTAVNSNGTRYTTADHLGSPRVITNSSAGVVSRHDYKPFGEDITNGGRTTGMGFGVTDGLRKQFTSQERDSETGLDYFGARYYAREQGRFTSVDPIMIGVDRVIDPQQLNLFVYARNNPLRFTDPTGEDIVENIDDEYKAAYEKWKKEYLSTEAGRKQWAKYADDKNFTLTITVSAEKGQEAEVVDYKWDSNGKLNAATIVLGSKIDKGYPTSPNYPITSSLQRGDSLDNSVPGEVLAATKLAHEFGHVNRTASVDASLYQLQNRLIPEWNAVNFGSGSDDPRLRQMERQMGGTPVSIQTDREHWGEANTIPYLKERFSGDRGSMPRRIKKAIESYQKTYPGR